MTFGNLTEILFTEYDCQAECINRIPKLPEEAVVEVLSIEARKLALEVRRGVHR